MKALEKINRYLDALRKWAANGKSYARPLPEQYRLNKQEEFVARKQEEEILNPPKK